MEFGIGRCKLLYIGCVNIRVLLYYPMINIGEEYETEKNMKQYESEEYETVVQLSHFAVQ